MAKRHPTNLMPYRMRRYPKRRRGKRSTNCAMPCDSTPNRLSTPSILMPCSRRSKIASNASAKRVPRLYTPVAPRQHHKRQSAFRSSTGFRRLSASPPCCAVSLGSCSSSTTTTPHHQPSSTSPTQARPKSNALLRKPHNKAFPPTT